MAKGSQPALGAPSLQQMSSVLPGALLGLALRANAEIGQRTGTTGMLNTQISNVPGPPIPLYCAGARLLKMYGLGPVVTGAALMHVVMSYCHQVTFSVTSDREILPDPAVYAEALLKFVRRATSGHPLIRRRPLSLLPPGPWAIASGERGTVPTWPVAHPTGSSFVRGSTGPSSCCSRQ